MGSYEKEVKVKDDSQIPSALGVCTGRFKSLSCIQRAQEISIEINPISLLSLPFWYRAFALYQTK